LDPKFPGQVVIIPVFEKIFLTKRRAQEGEPSPDSRGKPPKNESPSDEVTITPTGGGSQLDVRDELLCSKEDEQAAL
jgi:hypothetical protein